MENSRKSPSVQKALYMEINQVKSSSVLAKTCENKVRFFIFYENFITNFQQKKADFWKQFRSYNPV